jgi:L-aminoadipate-semialdehyde dehydrogenase
MPPSPFTVLLAAFVVLLHRYTGDEDIVVGSSSAAANPLVLRIGLSAEDKLEDVIRKVQQVSTGELTEPFSVNVKVTGGRRGGR